MKRCNCCEVCAFFQKDGYSDMAFHSDVCRYKTMEGCLMGQDFLDSEWLSRGYKKMPCPHFVSLHSLFEYVRSKNNGSK